MSSAEWNPDAAVSSGTVNRLSEFLQRIGNGGAVMRSGWRERFEQARLKLDLPRVAPGLAGEMERRLETFGKTLKAFEWPGTDSLFANSRLTVKDSDLEGRVDAVLPGPDSVTSYYKRFSKGFDKNAATNLAAGECEFTMSHGGETETLSVDVESGWTNGDLLSAVASAINDSTQHVQAEVVEQYSPELRVPGLQATGQALTIAVNGAYADQDLTLRNKTGHLLTELNLKTVNDPVGQAETMRYDLMGTQTAAPTAFHSKNFDPNETSSISAGTYDFSYALGSESGSVELVVESGDTWKDVLQKFGDSLESSAYSTMSANLVNADRPSDLVGDDEYMMMQGTALEITALTPKVGERLSLSGADSDAQAVLETLGLNGTAQPGSDAHMRVNGREYVRAPGVFTQDGGRLLLDLQDSFGETLPVSVTEPMGVMEERMADIVTAYNGLRDFILRNEDHFQQGLAEGFDSPLGARETGLEWLGLRRAGEKKLLWFGHDDFYTALGQEPDRARNLLAAGGGLFADWLGETERLLEDGTENLLAQPGSTLNDLLGEPSAIKEIELEKMNKLLDLYETEAPDYGQDESIGRGLVNKRG